MSGAWISLALAWTMLNGFALVVGSRAYTAWSIRTRREMLSSLTGGSVHREESEDADATAARVVRWLRPLLLVAANLFWIFLLVTTRGVGGR